MNKINIDIARKPITLTECQERWEIFSPSWELLMSYKDGIIDWHEFKHCYKQEMREAFQFDPDAFYEMADRLQNVNFICWCDFKKDKDQKCHKYLLIEILKKINKKRKV